MNHIKKILCGLLLVIAANTFAQVNNIYLGPEGGPGLGILWENANSSLSPRMPIAAGTAGYAFQYNFTKIFSIRTDVAYERAGTSYSGNPFGIGIMASHDKFDYMTIPILARATFGKKVNFFINAGPYFGVLVREVTVVEQQYSPKTVAKNTGYYKRFDTGITEGLGILIPIGYSYGISFEARDNTGLYNISKSSSSITRTNTTNFIFAFIYKLVTHKAAPKQKSTDSY